jgi:hypothetical protein
MRYSSPLRNVARRAAIGLGQVGAKALAHAVDSLLEDVENAFQGAHRRVRKARTLFGERRAESERDFP